MMWCAVIALAFLPLIVNGQSCSNDCGGDGRMVRTFNGRRELTKMPCKYPAVRVQCGRYTINLTPGNIYLHPHYRLDSLWLGIKDRKGREWKGRTDNKVAVKFMNGWKSELFNKKEGDLDTDRVLVFGKDQATTWARAKNDDFFVSFTPWDPDNDKFPRSSWYFVCQAEKFSPDDYPEHICGGPGERAVAERVEELGLKDREHVIYYDTFTNTKITQMNPKCTEATHVMTKMCNEAQRRDAILTCSQILSSDKHTKCATKYSCDPMDVFVDCVTWVCSGYKNKAACEGVAQSIDLCRNFTAGDLTYKIEAANCYKDFLPLI